MRFDYLDRRTAVQVQNSIGHLAGAHLDPACSAVQTRGAMLCDCGAVPAMWGILGGQNWERFVPPARLEAARKRVTRATQPHGGYVPRSKRPVPPGAKQPKELSS